MFESIAEPDDGPVDPAETALMIRRCLRCDQLLAPPTGECSVCRSFELEWVPSSGLGSIVSWRPAHRSVGRPHSALVPMTLAIVELDDGPWVYTTIEGDVPPQADRSIRVQFQPYPQVDRFPVFVVCPEQPSSDEDGPTARMTSTCGGNSIDWYGGSPAVTSPASPYP